LEEELNVKGVAIPKAGLSEENDQIKTNGNGRPNNCGRLVKIYLLFRNTFLLSEA